MAEKQAIKVSDEEVKKIKELRNNYQELIVQVGQAELQASDIQEALNNILEAKKKLLVRYNEIKQTERTHLDELNKKYGVGTLNVDTGLFVSTEGAPMVTPPAKTPPDKK
jgi:nucleoside-triphosphatase THEP1